MFDILELANSCNQNVVRILLILLFGFRALFNAAIPLSAEEAYYWAWSQAPGRYAIGFMRLGRTQVVFNHTY